MYNIHCISPLFYSGLQECKLAKLKRMVVQKENLDPDVFEVGGRGAQWETRGQ